MSSLFIRALSPTVQSLTTAVIAGADGSTPDDAACTTRHLAIMGANSVAEIIELIPSDYRNVLADALHTLVQLIHKLDNSRSTLAKWREHQGKGMFPPHLRGPVLRFSPFIRLQYNV